LIANPDIAADIEHKILVKLGVITDPNATEDSASNVESIEPKIAQRKGA
jgi:recombination protein RecA